ncbi:hypothetical protein [Azospirillum formosense]|uniref:hypothetical protein n=1 Tax=Azospirillum formosense TaxID=861533 RepID=UPI00338D9A30
MATPGGIASRVLMVLAGTGALIAVIGAFVVLGYQTPDTWAVLAASFAVITSIISAWTAMSVLEIERDKRRPDVTCYLDFTSRQGLVIFRMENQGGGIAYDAQLTWSDPMTDDDGKIIGFGENNDRTTITALRPGQSFAKVIDSAHHSVGRHGDKIYQGHVSFRDATGSKHRNAFSICVEDFFGTTIDSDDTRNAAVSIQRIPKHLEQIEQKLNQINNAIGRFNNMARESQP